MDKEIKLEIKHFPEDELEHGSNIMVIERERQYDVLLNRECFLAIDFPSVDQPKKFHKDYFTGVSSTGNYFEFNKEFYWLDFDSVSGPLCELEDAAHDKRAKERG